MISRLADLGLPLDATASCRSDRCVRSAPQVAEVTGRAIRVAAAAITGRDVQQAFVQSQLPAVVIGVAGVFDPDDLALPAALAEAGDLQRTLRIGVGRVEPFRIETDHGQKPLFAVGRYRDPEPRPLLPRWRDLDDPARLLGDEEVSVGRCDDTRGLSQTLGDLLKIHRPRRCGKRRGKQGYGNHGAQRRRKAAAENRPLGLSPEEALP